MVDATESLLTLNVSRNNAGRPQRMAFELRNAWTDSPCPSCGGTQALIVASAGLRRWLRCVTCLEGAVDNAGTISPYALPMRDVDNLPKNDALVWKEARTCLGAGAYMAAVMMCRKLLLHIAVENGLPPESDKGRSPGFKECVQHLESSGVITARMLKWVEPIKDVGNSANHEIKTVTKDEAEKVARFTEQLLVIAYELQADPTAGP